MRTRLGVGIFATVIVATAAIIGAREQIPAETSSARSVGSSVVFNGDYSGSGGAFFGWPGYQRDPAKPNAITRVTSPSPPSGLQYAARVQVDNGDEAASGNRAEVRTHGDTFSTANGVTHYITFALRLPSGMQAVQPVGGTGYLIPLQLHQPGGGSSAGQPPIRFNIVGTDRLHVSTYGGHGAAPATSSGQLCSDVLAEKETWHLFIIEVGYSSTGNGRLRVWHRLPSEPAFTSCTNRTGIANTYDGGISHYWKAGAYRSNRSFSTVLLNAGIRFFSDFGSAETYLGGTGTPPPSPPPAPPPPPTPPPPPGTVVISQTLATGTLSGSVLWRATVTGCTPKPSKVEFFVDGTLVLTEINSPYGDTPGFWNSATVPDGEYVLRVRAICSTGVFDGPLSTRTVDNVPAGPTLEEQIAAKQVEIAAAETHLAQLQAELAALEAQLP